MPELSIRQALSLGIMACTHVADENPDLTEWQQAACLLRSLLHMIQGPPEEWFVAVGRLDRRGGRHKSEYGIYK